MQKTLTIAVSCFAAAVVCVAAVLGIRLRSGSGTVPAEDSSYLPASDYSEESLITEDYTAAEISYTDEVSEITAESTTSVLSTTETSSSSFVTAVTTTEVSDSSLMTKVTDKVTSAVTQITSKASTTVIATTFNEAFSKVFSMPKTPKYIPPKSRIDFDKASLASYKYDPDGNYYYTDDKNAWQKGFGYGEIYDRLAVISAMYYDTVRNTFTYGGKEWLIQFWKGQYGFYFVGSEIGVYTRKTGSTGGYECADKEDWLKMEMCFIWDEDKNGNYRPIFKRPYDYYWWCTGFVVGYESEESLRSRKQFRLVSHITFKDNEMAELFCGCMTKNGFREVGSLDNNVPDTFVHVGPDVGFVWQNINQHVI